MSDNNNLPDISHVRYLLDYDPRTGFFRWINPPYHNKKRLVGQRAGRAQKRGYRQIKIGRILYYEHRLAWAYMTGKWPGCEIDHRDGDKGNNRFANLREATRQQNRMNSRPNKDKRSGLPKGVVRTAHRYRAKIVVKGKFISLGGYGTPEEAHAAYMAAAKLHFGEFARAA